MGKNQIRNARRRRAMQRLSRNLLDVTEFVNMWARTLVEAASAANTGRWKGKECGDTTC